ncbi:MAG: hypothetical protein AABZ39_14125 [Spirochaetota bacterium]
MKGDRVSSGKRFFPGRPAALLAVLLTGVSLLLPAPRVAVAPLASVGIAKEKARDLSAAIARTLAASNYTVLGVDAVESTIGAIGEMLPPVVNPETAMLAAIADRMKCDTLIYGITGTIFSNTCIIAVLFDAENRRQKGAAVLLGGPKWDNKIGDAAARTLMENMRGTAIDLGSARTFIRIAPFEPGGDLTANDAVMLTEMVKASVMSSRNYTVVDNKATIYESEKVVSASIARFGDKGYTVTLTMTGTISGATERNTTRNAASLSAVPGVLGAIVRSW